MATRYPRPKKPTPNFDPGSTSSVTNRVNTGQSSSSTQRTGATGDVRNTVNATTVQGKPGAPGKTSSTSINNIKGELAPQSAIVSGQIGQAQNEGTATALSQSAQAQANAAVAAARGNAQTAARGALDTVGSSLASTRQTVIEAVRKAGAGAEWEARVNSMFDEADKRVQEQKKRRG